MTIRVAINGYGRIGRNVLRAHYESGKKHDIEIVAINDLGKPETNAHLTQYDTAHGKFNGDVKVEGDYFRRYVCEHKPYDTSRGQGCQSLAFYAILNL